MEELRRAFRPEFLNRVDDVVLFRPLTSGEIGRIVKLLAASLEKRLQEQNISLEITEGAAVFIARSAYDPVYGARPLKRFMVRSIETPVARMIISGEAREGMVIVVDERDGHLEIAATAAKGTETEKE